LTAATAGRGGLRRLIGAALLSLTSRASRRHALSLRWSHVDLGIGSLHVVAGKTIASVRTVDLTPALREELILWRAESRFTEPDDFVVSSSTGHRHSPSNLRRDVLRPAIAAANVELDKLGIAPIGPVTFHSLRRTYASLRCAAGDDLRYSSTQIGHTDVRFTLNVYAQATKRREQLSGPHRKAYDQALGWAQMGTNSPDEPLLVPEEATKNPA
jgi:integrase